MEGANERWYLLESPSGEAPSLGAPQALHGMSVHRPIRRGVALSQRTANLACETASQSRARAVISWADDLAGRGLAAVTNRIGVLPLTLGPCVCLRL